MNMILKVDHLKLFTPDNRLLANKLGVLLEAGELLLVSGNNGSGKSTFIKTILNLHTNFEGIIYRYFSDDQVSYIPQLGNIQFLLPFTIRDVIQLEFPGISDSEITSAGLVDQNSLDLLWNTCSGGERQKALLTRCFLNNKNLIILDEPFNHLDEKSRIAVLGHMERALEQGSSIILISHEDTQDFVKPNKVLHLSGGAK